MSRMRSGVPGHVMGGSSGRAAHLSAYWIARKHKSSSGPHFTFYVFSLFLFFFLSVSFFLYLSIYLSVSFLLSLFLCFYISPSLDISLSFSLSLYVFFNIPTIMLLIFYPPSQAQILWIGRRWRSQLNGSQGGHNDSRRRSHDLCLRALHYQRPR